MDNKTHKNLTLVAFGGYFASKATGVSRQELFSGTLMAAKDAAVAMLAEATL